MCVSIVSPEKRKQVESAISFGGGVKEYLLDEFISLNETYINQFYDDSKEERDIMFAKYCHFLSEYHDELLK